MGAGSGAEAVEGDIFDEGEMGIWAADSHKTRTWDLTLYNKKIETLDELKQWLEGRMTLEKFLALPAALAMPGSIRRELLPRKLSKEFKYRDLLS